MWKEVRMKGRVKHAFAVTTFFLAVLFFVTALIATVVVVLQSRSEEPILTIARGENLVAEPVRFSDMSPGDKVEAQFQLRVAHRQTVTLHLRVELPEEAEPLLADALDVSVQGKDSALYSGQLSKASDITLTLFGEEKTEDVCYEIVTTLSADADSAAQGQSLAANYIWWVEEAEFLAPVQNSQLVVTVLILLLVLAVVLALLQLAFITGKGGNHARKRAR